MLRVTKVEKALQNGLNNGAFQVYYQPIFDNRTGKVHSAEALSRLIDPEMGFVSPDEFIAVAEESDLIFEVGEEMFRSDGTRAAALPMSRSD